MKTVIKKSRKAFTIVELLTVMSIIVILFSLLVPSMTMVRRYSKKVNQNAQFHAINAALQLFHNEWGYYPDSDQFDSDTPQVPYCGAMKLAEAMVGQDKLGFHPDSQFHADGQDAAGNNIYFPSFNGMDPDTTAAGKTNLRARSGPYLPLEGANSTYLDDIWPTGLLTTFTSWGYSGSGGPDYPLVLGDEYSRRIGAEKLSMPILYFKADPSKLTNKKPTALNNINTIYNINDNIDLLDLPIPHVSGTNNAHEIASTGTTPSGNTANPFAFYDQIKDEQVVSSERPHHPDTYILMSAGYDGVYGTKDDVFNFSN